MEKTFSFNDFTYDVLVKSSDMYNYDELSPINRLKQELRKNAQINNKIYLESFKFPIPKDKRFYHKGYLHYLIIAWNNNFGIQIGPWNIWEIILSNLSKLFKKHNHFNNIFDKQMIMSYDDNNFKIDEFTRSFRWSCPINMEQFIPSFEPAPQNYVSSLYAIFGSNSKNLICIVGNGGIPHYEIKGTDDDWKKVLNTLYNLHSKLSSAESINIYLEKCIKFMETLMNNFNKPQYWKNFMNIKISNNEYTVSGEIQKIAPKFTQLIHRFTFDNPELPDEIKKCTFITGCMYSNVLAQQNGLNILVPEYHCNMLYRHDRLGKLSLEDYDNKNIVIKFLKLMKHYDGTYDKYHEKITSSKKYMKHTQPCFFEEFKEDYIKNNDATESDDLDAYLKHKYKKYVTKIELNNKIVKEACYNFMLFLFKKNNSRKEILKRKYSIWLQDKKDIFSQRDKKLSYEQWNKLKKQEDLHKGSVSFTVDHMPIIYDYIKLNNYCGVWNNMFLRMYDNEVYKSFLSCYERKPFDIKYNWDDDHYLFEIPVNNGVMMLIYMVLGIYVCNQIDKVIKYNLIENLIKEFPSYHNDIIEECTKCIQKRIDQFIDYNFALSHIASFQIKNTLYDDRNEYYKYLHHDVEVCSVFAFFTKNIVDFTKLVNDRLIYHDSNLRVNSKYFDDSVYDFYKYFIIDNLIEKKDDFTSDDFAAFDYIL